MSTHDTAETAGDGEQWLSRRQIAALAHKSEKTIDRDAAEHDLEFRLSPNGTKLFRVADYVRIGRVQPTDIPNGLTGTQAVELLRVREHNERLLRQNGELAGRLEEVRASLALIRSQLEAKDAQIKAAEQNLRSVLELAARSAA